MLPDRPFSGAGLGLRRALLDSLADQTPETIQFMEVAPENWIHVGGRLGRAFRRYTERFPFVTHGLSLSLGGPSPLDVELLSDIRDFLRKHNVALYTEHLSYCSDDGHLYDLMPIPFTSEAVNYVASRIRQVQDFLGQKIAIENVSYYAQPYQDMSEQDFLCAVLEEADCDLLLDVNNVYVNAINHRYDAREFIQVVPGNRIAYLHVAGHFDEAEDLKVDTHGSPVKEDVWDLLDFTYQCHGVFPTLVERDFNLPPVEELLEEVARVRSIQQVHQKTGLGDAAMRLSDDSSADANVA